jgi:ribosomal protein S18 acetylase RimI-like enzyme
MVRKLATLHEAWDPQRFPYVKDLEHHYESWLRERAADARSLLLVAEKPDKQIIGVAIATVETNLPIYSLREYGLLHDVWVEEDYRHEGVARQLTMLVIERFKAMGVKQVRLETAALNDIARDLFVSCGFRLSTVEMHLDL